MAPRAVEPPEQARLALDYAIARILNESATIEEAAPALLAHIGKALRWELGAFWEVGDGEVLRCREVWKAPGLEADTFEQLSRSIHFAPGVGLPGRVWATRRPAAIADVTADPNFPRAKAAGAAGLRGAFGLPIAGEHGVLGVIEFLARDAREPDSRLVDLVEVTGSQIGQFMERKLAEESMRKSAALRTAMLESALDAVIAMDHEGRIVEFNPAAERVFGYRREEATGRELASLLIPPHLRDRHRHGLARYLASGEGAVLDKRIELAGLRKDGSEVELEIAITRIGSEEPPMFTGYLRDITDRKRGEQALRFLVGASAVLEESLDLDTSLQAIARLTVPYLADGCMVDLLAKDGSISRAASATADPSFEVILNELRKHSIDVSGPHPIAKVMRTGQTEIVPDVSEAFRRAISDDEGYYEVLQRWPARSVAIVPMKARGKLLGTLALASFSTERTYGAHEMSVVEELATRAANTIENAQLFEERSELARTLQQSLLPPRLPELPGAEVAARFQPAEVRGEIGGDFYDVFDAGDGCWAVVIGDVSGRGVEAAATTVLARHTIRAAAIQTRNPVEILKVLNEALRSSTEQLRFCTAIVGMLEFEDAHSRLTLASAGHPLPLLLHTDGGVETIGSSGTLLGIVAEPSLVAQDVRLDGGDTIVLYTNGVSETGIGHLPVEDLTSLVSSCVDLDAIATAECIDRSVVEQRKGNRRLDDAAILVLRIVDPEVRAVGPPALAYSET